MIARADAVRLPLADQSVDCVVGSPPYCDARTYGIGAQRHAPEWVDWMLSVSREALRVSRGPVAWVCASVTRGRNYQPAVEGLMWEWYRQGGHAYRPLYWHRAGIPGSGGDQHFRADVEYVLVLKRPGMLPYASPLAHGAPPKWGPGGGMSYRNAAGARRIITASLRRANGEKRHQQYNPPELANPGNVIRGITVGGGHLGHPLAHENEAPYPERLATWLLDVWCPPGGIVLDPFSGSGTTVAAARATGRRGIGTDIRMSQCELGRRRLQEQHVGMF